MYNVADFSSQSFNNGLPVNTGKKARVEVDKSGDTATGTTLLRDVSYNIADFSSQSFNNGLPLNTGRKAKVSIDKNLLTVSS